MARGLTWQPVMAIRVFISTDPEPISAPTKPPEGPANSLLRWRLPRLNLILCFRRDMSETAERSEADGIVAHLRTAIWGSNDVRIRAIWRVLLAWPLLWILTGDVIAGNLQAAFEVIPSGRTPGAGLAQSLLHGGFVTVAVVAWARYFDHRPLTDYGVSASPRWVRDVLVGFAAVVVGFAAWFALGSALGRTTVHMSTSYEQGSLLVGLLILFVALIIHAAIQQIVFFNIILTNAAEGLYSRGVATPGAVIGAVFVATVFFIGMHEVPTALRILDLAIAGAIFALLYSQTGELALGIGAHFGTLYAGNVLFSPVASAADSPTVFQVTQTLPGLLSVVNQTGFPKLLVAYLIIVEWLRLRHGNVSIRRDIAWRDDVEG